MTTDSGLPEDVRRFLLERVESYEQLETLLLLSKDAERAWTAEDVAAALRIPTAPAAAALEALGAKGLVETAAAGAAAARRRRGAPEVEDVIARLARAYDERRPAVMRQMSANAVERVRTGVIRTFADAFLWKGGRGDG